MTKFEFQADDSDKNRAYVLVDDRLELVIIRTDEGLVVDIYENGGIMTVATTYVLDNDLVKECSTIAPEPIEQKTAAQPSHEDLLDALEDLMCQANEDCPIQYRTSHLSNALTQAMLLLEMSKGTI